MTNLDEKKAPRPGDGGERRKSADESLPRDAGNKPDVEETEETFDLPEPKRQGGYDVEHDPQRRKADSTFEDLHIEVDESELEARRDLESSGEEPGEDE